MKTFTKPIIFTLISISFFSCSSVNSLVDSSELPEKPIFFFQNRPAEFIDVTLLPQLMTYGDSLLLGNLGEDPFSWMFGYHPGSFNLPSGFYGNHYYSRYAHGYYWGDAPTIQGFDGNFFTNIDTPTGLQYTNYFRPEHDHHYDQGSYQRLMTQVQPVRTQKRGQVKFHMKRSNSYSYSLNQHAKSEYGNFVPMFTVPGFPGYGSAGSTNSGGQNYGHSGTYSSNAGSGNTGNTGNSRRPASSGGGGGNTNTGHQAPLPSTPAPAGKL